MIVEDNGGGWLVVFVEVKLVVGGGGWRCGLLRSIC